MDLHQISLYLSGKFPEYYGYPFDKYWFIEIIRSQSSQGFSDDFFKFIDSQDFYVMCLNKIKRSDPESLIEIIKILNVPQKCGGFMK